MPRKSTKVPRTCEQCDKVFWIRPSKVKDGRGRFCSVPCRYTYQVRTGERKGRSSPSAEERFWSKVVKTETCWVWEGWTDPYGYGHFRVDGRRISTHRFAYDLLVGPIPPGLFVCHHCDNPSCVNPDHLFLGTHHDNMRDMATKGRVGVTANLSVPDVLCIRLLIEKGLHSRREVAEMFSISTTHVGNIVRRDRWKHL